MKLLCFGDSNTYGYDPRSFLDDRYPAEVRWTDALARDTGWTVLNMGQNGREIPCQPAEERATWSKAPVVTLRPSSAVIHSNTRQYSKSVA